MLFELSSPTKSCKEASSCCNSDLRDWRRENFCTLTSIAAAAELDDDAAEAEVEEDINSRDDCCCCCCRHDDCRSGAMNARL